MKWVIASVIGIGIFWSIKKKKKENIIKTINVPVQYKTRVENLMVLEQIVLDTGNCYTIVIMGCGSKTLDEKYVVEIYDAIGARNDIR